MQKTYALLILFSVAFLLTGCGGGGSSTPPPPSLLVTPNSAAVPIGGSQAFSVTNSTASITWTVSGPGSISPTGVYLAPSTFPNPNTVTVTAAAGNQKGSASVTVAFPNDNAGNQSIPIKLGTSGGNILDNSADGKSCCIGTLGSLWARGTGTFVLSNNHVLARSDKANAGEAIDQPGQPGCPAQQGTNVANLTEKVLLKPTSTFTTAPCDRAPSPCGFAQNNVDAAIAQIVPTTVDLSGAILDLGPAGATSIAAAPPSSQLAIPSSVLAANEGIAKVGRTTGLTCSTLEAINMTITVPYDVSCGAADSAPGGFTAAFKNQIAVNGSTFSAGGDSGSLIVTSDTARPLGLLFSGVDGGTTFANPIQDVITALTNASGTPSIVGGPDHPVSCDPTTRVQSIQAGRQSANVSPQQRQLAINARNRYATTLMSSDPAIRSVEGGASMDSPGEAAVLVKLSGQPKNRIPATLDGVRTRVVYAAGAAIPRMAVADVDRTRAIKEAHEDSLFGPGIQGVGVGRSDDSPGETAIVIYTVRGETHAPIPPVIDGVRTKIIEGGRIKAMHWNPQLEQQKGACSKIGSRNRK
jgi:hypothetical protein